MDDYKYHPRGGARGDGTPPFECGVREGAVSSPAPPPAYYAYAPHPIFFTLQNFWGRASGWGGGGKCQQAPWRRHGGAAC